MIAFILQSPYLLCSAFSLVPAFTRQVAYPQWLCSASQSLPYILLLLSFWPVLLPCSSPAEQLFQDDLDDLHMTSFCLTLLPYPFPILPLLIIRQGFQNNLQDLDNLFHTPSLFLGLLQNCQNDSDSQCDNFLIHFPISVYVVFQYHPGSLLRRMSLMTWFKTDWRFRHLSFPYLPSGRPVSSRAHSGLADKLNAVHAAFC